MRMFHPFAARRRAVDPTLRDPDLSQVAAIDDAGATAVAFLPGAPPPAGRVMRASATGRGGCR